MFFENKTIWPMLMIAALLGGCLRGNALVKNNQGEAMLVLHSPRLALGLKGLSLTGLFYETGKGRTTLPAGLRLHEQSPDGVLAGEAKMPDGRTVKILVTPDGDDHFSIALSAQPADGINKWGFAIPATPEEYFTGVMDQLASGPRAETWKPNRSEALNLRGQKIEIPLQPASARMVPFYLSSRGYALSVKGNRPGLFDFCVTDNSSIKVEFNGPTLDFKLYTADTPAGLVAAHSRDAGLPILPPKWVFTPWRWRDDYNNNTEYYDGTPVIGPYNVKVMEDMLIMNAMGISCGVYCIDRPWGVGPHSSGSFGIDDKRLPEFKSMVDWLGRQETKVVLGVDPITTQSQGKTLWRSGAAELLRQGVAGFKLDLLARQGSDAPEQYLKTTYEVAQRVRGDDFVLMPRAAVTGDAQMGVCQGGEMAASEWGLRASIIAMQRAAIIGYPFWGSETCGSIGDLDREVCARWLAFSCFSPIMEVGTTRNRVFWSMPEAPQYDAELLAIWRLYARLHSGLQHYSHECARIAHETGKPIIRPLFLEFPGQKAAWEDWGTYLYGPDIIVSPVWKKGEHEHRLYLPAGAWWVDAWNPTVATRGGDWVTVSVDGLHKLPLFVRDGSKINLGDLEKVYQESLAITKKQPDIGALDNTLRARFDRMNPQGNQ